MNIVIDIRPLMEGKLSGVEMYMHHLLSHLLAMDRENAYILFANSAEDRTVHFPNIKQENVSIIQTHVPNKILNASLIFFKKPKLDRLIIQYFKRHPHKKPANFRDGKIDVFFMPDLRPSALSKNVRKIMVVHDLSFHHFPQFFSARSRLWHRLMNPKKEITESESLIAVSHFTKKDLMETYKVDSSKIHVIHEGIENSFCNGITKTDIESARGKYRLPEKYFLFLSTLEPRKNINAMISAFQIFKDRHPENKLKLVVAGSSFNKIFSKVTMEKHSDVYFPGFIEEIDKGAVIKGAEAFIYPSLFEGFGLPLLEAMKCGTPVMTSNRSSMPEVIGNAGILVDPENPLHIAEAMREILKPDVRNRLLTNMARQIQKFSWEKCAKETLHVLTSGRTGK